LAETHQEPLQVPYHFFGYSSSAHKLASTRLLSEICPLITLFNESPGNLKKASMDSLKQCEK
jgi:hypothetical protein